MTARTVAVVLAGGTSRRFGSDKLCHPLGERTLLGAALSGLPKGVEVILVGPVPGDLAGIRAVREDPPGGGPAAAVVTGIRAALAQPFEAVLILPGDAPLAGHAAAELLQRLRGSADADAVMALDPQGREQPLQLALRPAAARALVAAAGENGGAGASARRLVHALTPAPLAHPLHGGRTFDIDTPEQLAAWLLRASPAVEEILVAVREIVASRAVDAPSADSRPVVVALDGPSAASKSTLAAALALRADAVVVPVDDFYAPVIDSTSVEERAGWSDTEVVARVFDWSRLLNEALLPLTAGRPAVYRPYDWEAADGRLAREYRLEPQPLVVLEGVYAARTELADLVDLAVYVDADSKDRQGRRDLCGNDPATRELWEHGERLYFSELRPPAGFDLRVSLVGIS